MDLEAQVISAVRAELDRQVEASESSLVMTDVPNGAIQISGRVDLEALALVVVGSVAGGP